MNEIGIDIETKSTYNLNKAGVYKYVESPGFAILLFAYSINGTEPVLIDLTADEMPEEVLSIINNPAWLKTAFNANFERVCINRFFGLNIPPEQWQCTMVQAANMSLPLSLDACSKVLGVTQKDREGKALIKLFCEKGIEPAQQPHKWQRFKDYCLQDVRVEQDIRRALKGFKQPDFENELWCIDQHINDTGVSIDTELIQNAITINQIKEKHLVSTAKELTGLENPNSVAQLKAWINTRTGEIVDSLAKDVEFSTDDTTVNKMLAIRKQLSKTSIKKYIRMQQGVCTDNRLRGLVQFYGANRTGRWAGRMVQVQNLPRNILKRLPEAREIVKAGDFEFLELIFNDVNFTLSQLIRTVFVPEPGYTFIISDFSAIEGRVLAWIAGEQWKIDIYNTHGKIYEAAASVMFKIPIEEITKGSDLRQKGKVSELALGYQGGEGALIKMKADRDEYEKTPYGEDDLTKVKKGMHPDEMKPLIHAWRKANPRIVKLWYDIQRAVEAVIQDGLKRRCYKVIIYRKGKNLYIQLPSGRCLVYLDIMLHPSYGISYKGLNDKNQWVLIATYGGKIVENITQAIARDCLAVAIKRLHDELFKIVMHVHDEVIIEVKKTADLDSIKKEIDEIMSMPVEWAPGLPLKGESFISDYYKKE